MKCRQARDLLELYGSGELSVKERRELEKHLSGCASCAKVRAEALAFSQWIAGLASAQPVLADGQGMVRAVMRSLDRPEVRPPLRSLLSALLTPGLRPAYSLALIVLAAVFAGQTTFDAWKLAGLEKRLGIVRPAPVTAALVDPQRLDLQQLYTLLPPGRLPSGLRELVETGRLPASDQATLALARQVEALQPLVQDLDSRFVLLDWSAWRTLTAQQELLLRDALTLLLKEGKTHER